MKWFLGLITLLLVTACAIITGGGSIRLERNPDITIESKKPVLAQPTRESKDSK